MDINSAQGLREGRVRSRSLHELDEDGSSTADAKTNSAPIKR